MTSQRPLRVAFGENARYRPIIFEKLEPCFEATFADLSTLDLSEFDIVVPLHLNHYTQLQKHEHLNGKKFLSPPSDAIETCHDKLKLKYNLNSKGFGNFIPRLWKITDGFPFVMKPRRSEWGQGIKIIRNADDLTYQPNSLSEWIFEEYLQNDMEFSFHMLMHSGRSVYQMMSTYEMHAGGRIKGRHGKPIKWHYERIYKPNILFEEIARSLNYSGTLCIDYKIIDGTPKIMEINPRFGGSLLVDINYYLKSYGNVLDLRKDYNIKPITPQ